MPPPEIRPPRTELFDTRRSAGLDATSKQLEQRRSQLAFADKRIGSFETRLTELTQLTDDVGQVGRVLALGPWRGELLVEITLARRPRMQLDEGPYPQYLDAVDQAGFGKGYPGTGPARISSKHTLALTNQGGADTASLIGLAREIRDGVRQAFGVDLVNEPVLVGTQL